MKSFAKFALISAAFLSLTAQTAAPVYNPEGLWLTENKRSVIELKKQPDGTLGGRIAWIIKDGMQFDVKNPDETKRNRPMCGLTIVSGLQQGKNNPNGWNNGKIYKADDGDMYDAKLTMESDNKLEVRGFAGISMFGKSQDWTRVSAKDYPRCKPAKK